MYDSCKQFHNNLGTLGKSVKKKGAQQSAFCYNGNQYQTNKYINKKKQNGMMTNRISKHERQEKKTHYHSLKTKLLDVQEPSYVKRIWPKQLTLIIKIANKRIL